MADTKVYLSGGRIQGRSDDTLVSTGSNTTVSSLTDVVFDASTMIGTITYSGNEVTLSTGTSHLESINANLQFQNDGTQIVECEAENTGTSAWITFGLASAKVTDSGSNHGAQLEYGIKKADDGRTFIMTSSGTFGSTLGNFHDNSKLRITNNRTTVTYEISENGGSWSSLGSTTHGTPAAAYYLQVTPSQTGTAGSYKFDYTGVVQLTTTTAKDKSSITDVPVGTRYEETDTRKIFRFAVGAVWVSTTGTLSRAEYLPAGSGDKTDGWSTTGNGGTPSGFRDELDIWNGTTWADAGQDCNKDLNASSGVGTSTNILVAGSNADSGADTQGCTRFASNSWTAKANTPEQRGYTCSGGTSSAMIWCGGAAGNTESASTNSWAEDSWTTEGNLPTECHMAAGDGTAINTMMVAGGKDSGYTDQTTTQISSGVAGSITWSSSPAVISSARSQCQGGGDKNGFWIIGGNNNNGVVEYYNGTVWATKPSCLLAMSGSAGANNGGTSPLVSGGKFLPNTSNNWNTGQYLSDGWVEKGTA